MTRKWFCAVMLAWLGGPGVAQAQARNEATRGELLYSTHCIGCHSAQLHWRDRKVARGWVSLKAEVRRWQRTLGLGWSEDDVTEVTRHLNARYYHFPAPDLDRFSIGQAAKPAPRSGEAGHT